MRLHAARLPDRTPQTVTVGRVRQTPSITAEERAPEHVSHPVATIHIVDLLLISGRPQGSVAQALHNSEFASPTSSP
ncbi:hypothetical protein NJ76_08205 [Rhodococcus sp. IITR03]|nr:hypothetical protein NJ76_08205 [Rhodococcus sp. IITR03]